MKPYLLFTWAANLVREPAILNAVEDLIGPDILVFHTTMWWKTKGSPSRVPWHQDGTYFGLAPHEHVTAWVALSPSNTQTGCVRILPGSHHAGQLAHSDHRDPTLMLSRGQTVHHRRRSVVRCPDRAVAGRILTASHDGHSRVRSEYRR